MNPASNSTIAARIRSGKYATPDELAQAMATALSGVEKHQATRRGLEQGQLVDKDGGTILSVEDQSASRQSVSMQPLQFGRRRNAGGAIYSRMDRRADILTRTVPAMVVGVEGEGAEAQITVALLANAPALAKDDQTNQYMLADPLSGIYNDADQQAGPQMTLPMTGIAFAGTGGSDVGTKIPAVGATVEVVLSDQNEKMTIWHRRGGRNQPRVINYPGSTGGVVVNGFCCTETGNDPGGS